MTRIVVSVPGVTFDNMLFGDGWQLGELEGWWDTTKPRIVSDARPEWHGDFGQDEVYLEPRFVTVSGVFQSRENPDLVTSARDTLAALHEAGEFEFTVSDGAVGRVTARMASELAWDVDYAPGCAAFEFTVKADDPRRYGSGQSFSTGVPTQGVGVADPVVDPVQEGVAVDVATNHAPSLYGPTVPVEVRRNKHISPMPSSAWFMTAGTGGATTVSTVSVGGLDFRMAEWTAAPTAGNIRMFLPGAGNVWPVVVPGEVVPVSMDVAFDRAGGTAWVGVDYYNGATWISAHTAVAVAVSSDPAAPTRLTFTPPAAPAGATAIRPYLFVGGALPTVGTKLWVSRVMVGAGSYFDGSTSPDPDMTARWLGTANASESVLEGLHPTAFSDTNCVSIIHEVGDGTRELRLIPTSPSTNDSSTLFPVPSGIRSSEPTAIATARLPAVITGSTSGVAKIQMGSAPWTTEGGTSNAVGVVDRRFRMAAGVTATRLRHGGSLGSGDVYWSKIGLFAGDYAGDWFDGNTQPHDNYIYKWAGVPYESVAIKQQIMHTPGNPGRIELTNTGTAPAEPMVRVTGGLSEGFELLCIETGSVVRVTRPVPDGSVIDIDMGGGQVWIDQQSPLSAMYVPVAQWFSVKPGHTCTIQFTPLGVQSGTPTMSVEFAEASW